MTQPFDIAPKAPPTDDDEIRAVVERLARRHPSGGTVIEHAAVLAEGGRSAAILEWISDHYGVAEAPKVSAPRGSGGLHDRGGAASRAPSRYILPAGALD
jgi:hypothetical protein